MYQELGYDIAEVMPSAVETGLFVSLFTAQQPTGDMGPSGAPTGAVTNVTGLINIACTAPPESDMSIQATETKALGDITASELHHVLLDSYYPALDNGWRGDEANGTGAYQALISDNDGSGNPINAVVYDILGVESDSQRQMTRVRVRLSTV